MRAMRLLTHNLPSPIGAERRMPIRGELRPLYPALWPELSRRVRFERPKSAGEALRRGRAASGAVSSAPLT